MDEAEFENSKPTVQMRIEPHRVSGPGKSSGENNRTRSAIAA